MSKFTPKPLATDDLNRALGQYASGIPAAVTPPSPSIPARATPTVQVNFKCSAALAELIAQHGAQAGSTRRFLARLMADAGLPVPEVDLDPPDPRKRGKGA